MSLSTYLRVQDFVDSAPQDILVMALPVLIKDFVVSIMVDAIF